MFSFKQNQQGALNTLLLPLIVLVLLLIGAVGFAAWAFSGRQNYKNNADQLIASAVTTAKKQQASVDSVAFAKEEENPLKNYIGPSAYGSLNIWYPKTWSGYVVVAPQGGSSTPVDGYFDPSVVPDITNQASVFALHIQVASESYSDVLQQFNSQVQQGTVTVNPYSLPKVPSVVGVRVDGEIAPNIQGSLIVLPLRDTTLEISTQSQSYEADFDNTILPNFSFSP